MRHVFVWMIGMLLCAAACDSDEPQRAESSDTGVENPDQNLADGVPDMQTISDVSAADVSVVPDTSVPIDSGDDAGQTDSGGDVAPDIDAGDPCADVGCGSPPVCGEMCSEVCGCCDCAGDGICSGTDALNCSRDGSCYEVESCAATACVVNNGVAACEATCAEMEAEYEALITGTATRCSAPDGCQVLNQHCSVGLGGCYAGVNLSVMQSQLDAVAARWVALGCDVGRPVCDCAPPPSVRCDAGGCLTF